MHMASSTSAPKGRSIEGIRQVIGSDDVQLLEVYPASEGFVASEDPRHGLLIRREDVDADDADVTRSGPRVAGRKGRERDQRGLQREGAKGLTGEADRPFG